VGDWQFQIPVSSGIRNLGFRFRVSGFRIRGLPPPLAFLSLSAASSLPTFPWVALGDDARFDGRGRATKVLSFRVIV
jgi:hypothetical protein